MVDDLINYFSDTGDPYGHGIGFKFKFPAISLGGVYGFVVTASFLIGLQIKIGVAETKYANCTQTYLVGLLISLPNKK